jgi:probable rRNA maturation factor
VTISNRQGRVALDESRLLAAARAVLADERVAAARIGVLFVDDAAIHLINRRHLNHDEPTDVLSFLLDASAPRAAARQRSSMPERRGAGKQIGGEIVISAEMAARQAELYHWGTDCELLLYQTHGLLHLCGYDDLTAAEAAVMRSREAELLALLGVARPHLPSAEDPGS